MAKQAIVRLAIAFAALLFAARLHAQTVSYTFKYTPEGNKPTSVHVAGEFNNWSSSANPMADADGDGTWEATLELGEGHHSYKFVINGSEWINDPKADPDLAMEDGHGGQNSGVHIAIGPNAPKRAPSVQAVKNEKGETVQRFTYYPPAGQNPKSVALAGTFNGWSSTNNPMTKQEDGSYTADIALADGKHQYKFVIDGNQWTTDPRGDKSLEEEDTYGGKNSGVIVGPDIRKAPPAQSNKIHSEFIRHNPTEITDADRTGPNSIRLRIRAQAGDVQKVHVLIKGSHELPLVTTDNGFDVFGGIVTFSSPADSYSFLLTDDQTKIVFNSIGAQDSDTADKAGDFSAPQMRVDTPDWATNAIWYQIFPERFRNGEKSNDPGDAEFEHLVRWQSDWWKTQPGEEPGDENFYQGKGNVWKRRYGGDLQGAREALPYLRQLGVNAIYFNPIFEAESMHKYDTADFRHVDDNFGYKGDIAEIAQLENDDPSTWQWTKTDRLFLEFIDEAHRQGFKVIIDGVFNHVGRAHPFFMDVLAKGKKSKYADWFEITDWGSEENWQTMDEPFEVHGKPGGIQWRAWDGDNGHLPVFKKDAQLGLARGPREHIFAITTRWLAPDGDRSRGIDGWRLDVPGDIPHPFWRDWRKLVKSTKPDAYITGEIWSWAQPWLNNGDQFDAVMNYQFAMPAQQFFVNQRSALSPSQFNARLAQLVFNYPWEVALVQQNLFDSHDTDRLASMFVNPDRPYDGANRPQDNAKNFNGPMYSPDKPDETERARMMQAVACQMTFVGAPMIYYGNEAGMWSPDDPSNRQPMIWKDHEPYDNPEVKFDADLFAFYQRLIALRASQPVLRLGFYYPVLIDDSRGILAYGRRNDDQHAIVLLNRSADAQQIDLPLTGTYVNWLDGTQASLSTSDEISARPILKMSTNGNWLKGDGKLSVSLKPYESMILIPAL